MGTMLANIHKAKKRSLVHGTTVAKLPDAKPLNLSGFWYKGIFPSFQLNNTIVYTAMYSAVPSTKQHCSCRVASFPGSDAPECGGSHGEPGVFFCFCFFSHEQHQR